MSLRGFLGVRGFLLVVAVSAACPAGAPAQAVVAPPARYAAVAAALERFLAAEVEAKQLPALSIALVDDQEIVWARGFGHARPRDKQPATAATIYRVGSVSKLFTDLAVMQLVEQGTLDLDAPVTRYLPEFRPANPSGKAITLRQLMAHRAGLVREPPVGHYFDPTRPTLAATVASLNATALVYPPETRVKYSNAGIAVVGRVLEQTQRQPFAAYVQQALLQPLGLRQSGFEATPDLARELASATMWTYHGRTFDAPTFPLGMAPAGSLYASVTDLGRFLSALFAGGRVVRRETLEAMWRPQFAGPGETSGFGIGFHVSELAGRRRVGHGGAIYGFATELAALPDDRLGVVVAASKDCANGVTRRIANAALLQLLAARQGQPLPPLAPPTPLDPEQARRLAGRYQDGDRAVDLLERAGRLYLLPARGGFQTEVRAQGERLVVDDALAYGPTLQLADDALRLDDTRLRRQPTTRPEPAPARWRGLIGEYGWDHNGLTILEKDGKLHALIEWFFLYPLEEVSADEYRFPSHGLYQDETVRFRRDARGRATEAEAGGIVFRRRLIDGEDGGTFRIRPVRPVEELRQEALRAQPPAEGLAFARQDLVDVTTLDPTLKLDIRYATANNFLGTPLYSSARAFLQRPAAEALVRAHRGLAAQGYGLLIHDGYRPWYVTRMFWDATPPEHHLFVADPSRGSRHNRGCAVDLTLYDRATGQPVEMVGGYDEFSDRSYPDYLGGTSLQRWHRELLRRAMEAQDFTVYEAEWWHFDYKDWKKYAIGNRTFEQLGQ